MLSNEEYVIALLERIAVQTYGGPLSIDDYLDMVKGYYYASRGRSTVQGKDDKKREEDTSSVRQRHK